jgi:hypothetical protein
MVDLDATLDQEFFDVAIRQAVAGGTSAPPAR